MFKDLGETLNYLFRFGEITTFSKIFKEAFPCFNRLQIFQRYVGLFSLNLMMMYISTIQTTSTMLAIYDTSILSSIAVLESMEM